MEKYKYGCIYVIFVSQNCEIMSSFTVSLTGNSSELTATFFPELVLDERYEYSCGLLDFTTYHSIPNVNSRNNCLEYSLVNGNSTKMGEIIIPIGSYEADEVLQYIKSSMHDRDISFEYYINKNTLKTRFMCSAKIFFGLGNNSILNLFGFNATQTFVPNTWHESDSIVKISKSNVIRLECNIVTGAYINGKLCHSIYEFASNKVDVGYKIIEQPRNIIYLPIVRKRIDFIQITIVDQEGAPIDFRGEDITCRIHIRRDI